MVAVMVYLVSIVKKLPQSYYHQIIFLLPLDDNDFGADFFMKKIVQRLFERFFLYLHHYALCTFFAKFSEPFLQNGHFYFSKNVQNQKRPTNLDPPFFWDPY